MLQSIARIATLIALIAGLVVGCGEKEEGPHSPTAKPKSVTTDAIKVPASVWVYGGSQPLGATLDGVTAFAQQVIPSAPSLKEMVGPLLVGNFGVTQSDFVDLSRPLRFAVFAPNPTGEERVAFLLPVKDTKGFAALVSDKDKATNVENNALVYTPNAGGPKAYVNFTGAHAVYTTDAKLYGAEKTFIEGLSKATMPVSAAAYVQVANIMKAVGKDFDAALAGVKAEMRRTMTGPARNQVPMLDAIMNGVGATAREIERVRFGLVVAPDGLQLDFRVAARADAELAGTFAKLKSDGHPLLARLPADAAFFASCSLDPKFLSEWSQTWVSAFVMKPIFGDQPKAKKYMDAMMAMIEALTGDFAVSAHGAPDGLGLTLSSIFGVTDSAKVNAAQDTIWNMYSEPEMIAYNTRHGLKLEFGKPTPFAGTTIRENRIAFTQLGMNPAAAMMGDIGQQYIAVGKELGVMSYGAAGKTVVEGFLKGTYKGLHQTPAAKRLVAKGAKNAFGLLYVSPLALAQRMHLGGMNPVAASLTGLSAKSGVAFSAGLAEGQLQVVVDLPIEFAIEAFSAFQKLKGSL